MPNPPKTAATAPTESHSASANALLTEIRAIREKIPGFAVAPNKTAAQRLVANAGLDDAFLETVCVAVQSSPSLQAASNCDVNEIREAIRFAAAYGAVADELESLASAVRFTINSRRSAAGQECLAAYDLAKGLARKPAGANLVPHIADMKRDMNRGGNRKKAKAADAPTAQFKAGKDLQS